MYILTAVFISVVYHVVCAWCGVVCTYKLCGAGRVVVVGC